jgi:tetratricopeptide (TPR) repeat protein
LFYRDTKGKEILGDGERELRVVLYIYAQPIVTIFKTMSGSFGIMFYITLLLSTPIIVFFHELGHSLLALLFTKEKVEMFIGSYGKTTDNYNIKIGRLHIHVERKVFKWRSGMCRHQAIDKKYKQIFQILAGPVFPVIIALIFYAVADRFFNDYIIGSAIFLILFCSFSLLYNLIPSSKPIIQHNGKETFNDGKLILLVIKNLSFLERYQIAAEYYNGKNYAEAFKHFKAIIDKHNFTDNHTHMLCIQCLYSIKDIDQMKYFIEESEEKLNFNSDELSNIGVFFSRLGDHEIAMAYYEKSLALTENANALNNMGYSLNLLERYTEALPYFDKAISIDPEPAYAYNNRGYAKLKLGFIEEGFEDFQMSYKLDPNNSYYFKNLGLYHLSKNEYSMALELFEKAKELDADTYKIDVDIEMAKALI